MKYAYKARDLMGQLVNGVIESDDEKDLSRELRSRNLIPISISESTESSSNNLTFKSFSMKPAKLSIIDLVLLSRQLYSLLSSGVPLNRSLRNIQNSFASRPALANMIGKIIDDLESGVPLSAAMAKYRETFPPLYINVIRVSETTGRMDDGFKQLSEYLETDMENRKRVKSALRYPMIVVIAMVGAFFVLNTLVIPSFEGVFKQLGVDLPLPTRILIATSDFVRNQWGLMFTIVAVVFFGIRWSVRQPWGVPIAHRTLLSIPVIGEIVDQSLMCRFCRSLGLTLEAGVPLMQALNVVGGSLDNVYMEGKINEMRSKIDSGEPLIRAAYLSGLFTPLVMQMISVGDETGRLDEMLVQVADHYDRETKYSLQKIATVLEPLIVVVMGGMVLLVALGIFLPMWELSSGKGLL